MKNLQNFKNIIFDFGGVILNIDLSITYNALQKLNFINFEQTKIKIKQEKLFERQEIGLISNSEFYNFFNSEFINPVSEQTIEEAWNEMLLDYPEKNIQIIQNLKSSHRLFLLSNTNKIHYDFYIKKFKTQFGFELRSLFEQSYFSHEIGMRKPNKEIFEKVINENNLLPLETLFIDDIEENRITAQNIGIQTINTFTNEGLSEILKNNFI